MKGSREGKGINDNIVTCKRDLKLQQAINEIKRNEIKETPDTLNKRKEGEGKRQKMLHGKRDQTIPQIISV